MLSLTLALLAVAAGAGSGTASLSQGAASAQLVYVDKLSDKVGESSGKPDGTPDGHFRLTVTADDTVTGITLATVDSSGNPCCGQVWNTTPNDGYWILGVFRGSTELNPIDENISDRVSGSVTYDIYGDDSGYFTTGQAFGVYVTLASGTCLSAGTQIGGGSVPVVPCPVSLVPKTAGGGGGGGGGPSTTTTSGGAATPPTATAQDTVTVNGQPFTGGTIPFNSTVDVTHGAVNLTGSTGNVELTGNGSTTAAFVLAQTTVNGTPVTVFRLTKGNFAVCPTRKTANAGSPPSTTVVRELWGNGKGNFQTQGRYAAATVRGTYWLTVDRCDGTLTTVLRGVVQVTDLVTHTTVSVRAGHSYLAKG